MRPRVYSTDRKFGAYFKSRMRFRAGLIDTPPRVPQTDDERVTNADAEIDEIFAAVRDTGNPFVNKAAARVRDANQR